jgi:hypothetical protein
VFIAGRTEVESRFAEARFHAKYAWYVWRRYTRFHTHIPLVSYQAGNLRGIQFLCAVPGQEEEVRGGAVTHARELKQSTDIGLVSLDGYDQGGGGFAYATLIS